MEHLTKQQLILLAILVSFVTSIATGVMTVALLDEAPAGVTQTINRVVERTIEKVVQIPSQASVVTTKETVIINTDDLVAAAVERNSKSLVRIYRRGITDDFPELHDIREAIGFIISRDGVVATDKNITLVNAGRFASLSGEKAYTLEPFSGPEKSALAFFRLIIPTKGAAHFEPVAFGNPDSVKLGQTVVAIGGQEKNVVALGIVNSINTAVSAEGPAATSTPPKTVIVSFETTADPKQPLGGVLLNLKGEVIGFKAFDDLDRSGVYAPIYGLDEFLLKLNEPAAKRP